jgi:hypothetical protein
MAGFKPHKLIVEDRDGYLYVEYGGNPLTLQMIIDTINHVGTRIEQGGYKRVLIVRDAPLLESDENRALVAGLIKNRLGSAVKFAIVDIHGNNPKEVAHAVEASRAGGWDLTGFDTIDEAIHWLKTV